MKNVSNKSITLIESILPVLVVILLLSINIISLGDEAMGGANQFALILGTFITFFIGFKNRIPYHKITKAIARNFKSVAIAILILLLVGALSGTWLVSGIIPAMIYYGVQILHPLIFLVACVFICILISLSTGSSWSTSATVGIALIGIGRILNIPDSMTAGAIISGAYFGDKISPLSETTNLASSIANVNLFDHIRYLLITTIPSIIITIIIFLIIGFSLEIPIIDTGIEDLLLDIEKSFYISPILFIPPVCILILIIKKVDPLISIFIGMLLGGLFAIIFQPEIILHISGDTQLGALSIYKGVMSSITTSIEIPSDNPVLKELFISNGMKGMLNTVWLIISAISFGGSLEGIGSLKVITDLLSRFFKNSFGVFASTTSSCLFINVTTSDQYLSIVLPGKMFSKAFKNKNLAPENLSRTLEDSGTVTSVLIPWNTCGAFQSSALGVSTMTYLPYAFFNIISPIMTLFVAFFKIKIKEIIINKSERKDENNNDV